MYDARERAIRDREWELDAKFHEGKLEGEIKGKIEGKLEGKLEGEIKVRIEMARTLQGLAGEPVAKEDELRMLTLEQLQALTGRLQEKLRSR